MKTRCRELDKKFIDDFEETVDRIRQNPKAFPIKQRQKRRALMQVFPYAVYFQIVGSKVYVLGVIHGKRHPKI